MQWKVATVVEDHGSYFTRLYEGKRRRKIRLGRVEDFPTKASLESAVREVRGRTAKSGRNVSLSQFIRWFFLPVAKSRVRRSTFATYEAIYRRHLRPNALTNRKLWEWSTVEVVELLHSIAAKRSLSRRTLAHIKAFLSGVFRHSLQLGFFRGANPVHAASIPSEARESSPTVAYTSEEVRRVLRHLDKPSHRAAFAIAAYAGLRLGEVQGLEWADLVDGHLHVRRSVVKGETNAPKSLASRASVPVIPQLRSVLSAYRRSVAIAEGPMFPFTLAHISRRALRSAFSRAKVQYAAWHAARRGLATNLFESGADDLTVMRAMRHASVQVTRESYIKLRDRRLEDAMKKFSVRERVRER
ncbi:MAG: tyrosine-type recombinase/integrase [Terriglobales bacterium]